MCYKSYFSTADKVIISLGFSLFIAPELERLPHRNLSTERCNDNVGVESRQSEGVSALLRNCNFNLTSLCPTGHLLRNVKMFLYVADDIRKNEKKYDDSE